MNDSWAIENEQDEQEQASHTPNRSSHTPNEDAHLLDESKTNRQLMDDLWRDNFGQEPPAVPRPDTSDFAYR